MAADPKLDAIVQRMIDAGEPEDNIATVIRDYTPAPTGDERHRVDTNVIGFNHDWVADKASKLPESLQYPAAFAGSLAGHVLESLSAPEAPVTMGAGKAMSAMDAAVPHAGRLIAATGRGMERTGAVLQPVGNLVAGYGALEHQPLAAGAAYVAPRAAQVTGRLMQRVGKAMAPAPEAPSMAHLDLSVPVRPSQLTPEQLGERIRFGTGTPPARVPKAPIVHAPEPVAPMPSHPPAPVAVVEASPLKQPRVAIGAEKVGRAQGLTKEQVRVQTGPVLNEKIGQASPIMPEQALGRIIDTIKALPKEGGAREAYVQAATSGKAQWQIENIRRTLEHLGLLVPLAVSPLNGEIQKRLTALMPAHQPQ